jgi:hypothetical protein
MLFFAMFTLGYFFGVFMALVVFARKETVEETVEQKSSLDSASLGLSSWDLFYQLTRPNQPGQITKKTNKLAATQV